MIGYAKQAGPNRIEIFDPQGRLIGTCYCSTGGRLLGFTATAVAVQQNPTYVQIFDEHGNQIGSRGG